MNGYDLIITVINRGFADDVMDAAREAGASGGTILSGRGAGAHYVTKFFGAVVEPEKELVLILIERGMRNAVMEAIGKNASLSREGTGVCFSLPVDSVFGVKPFSDQNEEKPDGQG